MDFSSLVLMERDKETNAFVRELGSYVVNEGAKYVTKMFYDGDNVNVFFDTNRDVEEWEYSAIFDLFNSDVFEENGFKIEDVDDEYNPTWKVKFLYNEKHEVIQEKINELCDLIEEEIENVFENIRGKEGEYV